MFSYMFSTFSTLLHHQLHPVRFCLQQREVEAELQVLFSYFNTLAVTNAGADTFLFSCFHWTIRDHSFHLTLIPACTCGFCSSESPKGVAFPLLSPEHCVCSQFVFPHKPSFQSLLDLVLMGTLFITFSRSP